MDAAERSTAVQSIPQPASLLLVDDDDTSRDRLARTLQERGFDVRTASSVDQALELAREAAPEYAVLDVKMPDGDGMDLLRALHRMETGTQAVVLTGHGSIAAAVQAVHLGAVNFIPKPADADDVLAAFEKVRQERSPGWRVRDVDVPGSEPRAYGMGAHPPCLGPTVGATSRSPRGASGFTAGHCNGSCSAPRPRNNRGGRLAGGSTGGLSSGRCGPSEPGARDPFWIDFDRGPMPATGRSLRAGLRWRPTVSALRLRPVDRENE